MRFAKGPLDKKGAGFEILGNKGKIKRHELERLRSFARDHLTADGSSEIGLGLPELRAYMDANFERAAGRRQRIDRVLLIGEWPVL